MSELMTEQEFIFEWTEIGCKKLAEFEGLLGRLPVEVNGTYWRQVRPGFFRPLLQYKKFSSDTLTVPRFARVGAAQYAVTHKESANSFLNCLFFEETSAYTTASLEQSLRRQIRIASKKSVIRKVTDLDEFKSKGHAAYLSFYERTKYDYGSKRRDPKHFHAWAEALFKMPEILVLGGYINGELTGVSLSHFVEDTVHYATFFCTTQAMQDHLSGFMLHAVRSAASRQTSVKRIFAGMYKGGGGLDDYYMLRGAKCVQKPALLQINPAIRIVLKNAAPSMYAKILGIRNSE